jgi:hypothetical protein
MAEDAVSGNRRPGKSAGAEADFAFRRFATLGLVELVPGVTRAAYKKRSPAGALLLSAWEEVVGPRLARDTMPQKVSRGVLTIVCTGPVAMELQHLSAMLIERINTHAGGKLVERLRFVQGLVPSPAPVVVVKRKAVEVEKVAGVDEGDLNEALGRLLAALRGG